MSPAVSGSSKKGPSLKSLCTKLKGQQTSLNNISRFVEDYPEGTTASQITVRLERLDDLWEKISDSIYEIEAHEDFAENEAFSKERTDFENRYYDIKSFLLDKAKEFHDTTVVEASRLGDTTMQNGLDHVRLPQIKLQQFDGNIDEWLSFRDLFCSLIHWKTDLPEVEKFHYLKGCLGGEAKALIDPLKITRTNYQIAWDTLTKRYNNSKLLKRKQVRSLFNLPVLGKESVADLQGLLEGFERSIQTLDQVIQPADYKDLLLIHLLGSRLDPSTRRGWEEFSSNNERDTLKELIDFIQRRIRILESLPPKVSEQVRKDSSQTNKPKPWIRTTHSAVQSVVGKCPACSENHMLHLCKTFLRMTVSNRESLLRCHSLCRNCLKRGHQARDCLSKFKCRKCRARHHTMLCFKGDPERVSGRDNESSEVAENKEGQVVEQAIAGPSSKNTVCSNMAYGRVSNVLLATAVILIEDDIGCRYPARALLDSGSECNFMTEKLSQRLKVQREKVDVSVLGIGQSAAKARQRIRAVIKSRTSSFCKPLSFLVLPKVTVDLPTSSIHTTRWNIPEDVELADPAFFKSSEVDLVIGIQAFFSLFRTGREIALGEGLPQLTETVFGWLVTGEVAETSSVTKTVCNVAVSENLEMLLERFWSCEDVGAVNNYSPQEAHCEEQFGRTVERGTDGRYTVTLPKNEAKFSKLGESREIAMRRLHGIERRLARQDDLRKQYHNFMAEYAQLGHMRRVDYSESDEVKRCYLPHHPVIKEASTTTKVRVVFDASCKTASGISLNDGLLTGPVVQQDLRTIVLRSRTHQVMIVVDVEKMFRQIKMHSTDTPLQSILWRLESGEIATYELTTVTYGTRPAPFLATRTLKQLAIDERVRFPLAAQVVNNDVYMDDVISGSDDIETAIELRKQLDEMMANGGFMLRKWASNCSAVLKGIPPENLALPICEEINWDIDQTVKTLGLAWLPKTDKFKFQFNLPAIKPGEILTKRKILSTIAMLFDPLGLLGATVTLAKIMLQRLWSLKDENENRLDWDAPVPSTVGEEWRNYHAKLASLNHLRVPRCVIMPGAQSIEIHCFSDASEKAYGACLYIRSIDSSENISVHLFMAKSKVAPLKVQSLPRLELCGALLAAQIFEKATEAINRRCKAYFWTDSTCVLRWISATPSTWTTFVANRVAKIQGITEGHSWHHVPGVCNPADMISRGIQPDAIQENRLWWEGPDWLKENMEQWPFREPDSLQPAEFSEERRKTACTAAVEEPFGIWFISKFSSYTKMIRSTAYYLRLKTILLAKEKAEKKFLTVEELKHAEEAILKFVQYDTFPKEIAALSTENHIHRGSPLRWFNPTISRDGLLRVGGRLTHSNESYNAKHPIILPAKHSLTDMIMRHYHTILLHAGPQLLLSTVRLRFWPLGGRNSARKAVQQCHRCFRAKPTIIQQQMGELPKARVTISRPFSKTGVDYFGPVYLRAGRRQSATKAYVALFVCMCTKAVHLELVSDLSTERFLQALRRFVGRRGKCTDIYSDNGTNFVGAKNQLRELFNLFKNASHNEAVTRECANQGIQWHFNPPGAPHFGGLWEAAVRSTKHHLLRVLGGNPVHSEDFTTLLVQVEACLNSRPLTALSDDPTELQPLTPAHFLSGGPLQALPEPDYSTVQLNRLNRWQVVQRQLQEFWRRWRMEYLSQLQARTKNWKPAIEIDVGKLVVIVDSNLPPLQWKMGRIHQLHPGADGVTRVATIKTATGFLTRPIVKLCILPTQED